MKKLLLAFFAILFLLLTPLNLVLAENSDSNSNSEIESIKTQIEDNRQQIQEHMQQRKEQEKERLASKSAELKDKLDAKKLDICEKRKDNIDHQANNISSRAENHFNRFGQIVTMVDKFYTEKLVPKGVVVTNYDALKADIAKTQADAQAAIEAAKAKIATFDCASDNPKSQLEDYKAETKTVYAALKDYRTAIKNFILAIKAGVDEKKIASPSAEID